MASRHTGANMIDRIIRFKELRHLTGLSRSTIYLHISAGMFPRQIRLTPRTIGWRESEVAAMLDARARDASDTEVRELVKRLEAERKESP